MPSFPTKGQQHHMKPKDSENPRLHECSIAYEIPGHVFTVTDMGMKAFQRVSVSPSGHCTSSPKRFSQNLVKIVMVVLNIKAHRWQTLWNECWFKKFILCSRENMYLIKCWKVEMKIIHPRVAKSTKNYQTQPKV